jgi:hypothetical protein
VVSAAVVVVGASWGGVSSLVREAPANTPVGVSHQAPMSWVLIVAIFVVVASRRPGEGRTLAGRGGRPVLGAVLVPRVRVPHAVRAQQRRTPSCGRHSHGLDVPPGCCLDVRHCPCCRANVAGHRRPWRHVPLVALFGCCCHSEDVGDGLGSVPVPSVARHPPAHTSNRSACRSA